MFVFEKIPTTIQTMLFTSWIDVSGRKFLVVGGGKV